jgi:hypothetical protein
VRFKCICDGFGDIYVFHKHKINFGNAQIYYFIDAIISLVVMSLLGDILLIISIYYS